MATAPYIFSKHAPLKENYVRFDQAVFLLRTCRKQW